MILPSKHVRVEQSLIGLGAVILARLERTRTVSSLWDAVRDDDVSFDRFSLCLSFLFGVGAVEFDGPLLRKRR